MKAQQMLKKIMVASVATIGLTMATSAYAADAPKGTLIYCSDASPEGFDTSLYTSVQTVEASSATMFDTLVRFEVGGTKVVPALASSWDVSPDGKEWIFHLRKGVKFHTTSYFKPTRDFDADDVTATFDRMLNKNNAFQKAYPSSFPYFSAMDLDKNIKSVEKIDNDTVKFTLKNVDAAFIQTLAIPEFIIHSGQYMEQLLKEGKASDINQKPIGTGPFQFVRYQKDAVIRFKANPDFWDKASAAKVENLVFAITKDPSVRVQKLKAGECQISRPVRPEDLTSLKDDSKIKILSIPGFSVSYIYYNMQKKPLDNPRVRQALDMAINKEAIVKAVYDGQAVRVANPMPPSQWSYNKNVAMTKYDPEQAKKLLAEAGFPNGFSTTFWTSPNSNDSNPNGRLMGEMIQADWKKIGVNATLQTYEWGEYLKRAQQGEHNIIMASWIGDNGDPDNWLNTVFGCSSIGGNNYAFFCNKQYQALLDKARQVTDVTERTKLYEQAQVIYHEQMPASPIASAVTNIPMYKSVENFKASPFGVFFFGGVSVKN